MFFFVTDARVRIDNVRDFLRQCFKRTIALPNGEPYRMGDGVAKRMRLFMKKGVTCVSCQRTASVIFMDQRETDARPYPNLYIKTKNDYVVMTMDHIVPKVRGGNNSYENLQPMCSPCNSRKSDSEADIDWLRTPKAQRRVL